MQQHIKRTSNFVRTNLLRHYTVLFSLFVLIVCAPLAMLIVLQQTTPQVGTNLNTSPGCYYKKLTCNNDANCDSYILTCPSSLSAPQPTQAAAYLPTGLFETADCQKISGWAYNTTSPKRIMQVYLYADGQLNSGTYIARVPANLNISDNDIDQIFGSHEFSYPLPYTLKDGAIHQIYAYAQDASSSAQLVPLLGSPKNITCQPVVLPTRNFFYKYQSLPSGSPTKF